MKVLLVTEIKTNLDLDEIMKIADSRAALLQDVEGLKRNYWTYDDTTQTYHGIFEFEHKKYAEEFLCSKLIKSMDEIYQTTQPVTVRASKVIKELQNP